MIDVIVPFRGGCPRREAAWRWCRERYVWPVVEAPGGEPWIKSSAVMPAIATSDAEVVVVADADVWCDGLPQAVEAVKAGAPWAIPHSLVHRLSEDGTAALLGGEPWQGQPVAQRPYRGLAGGGYVVIHREIALAVPLDPRFIGWGQEDECWSMALYCLVGPPWRGVADLIHLYHPPPERLSRKRGNPEGWRLRQRYAKARRDPQTMRALLEEIDDSHGIAEPNLHDHPKVGVG